MPQRKSFKHAEFLSPLHIASREKKNITNVNFFLVLFFWGELLFPVLGYTAHSAKKLISPSHSSVIKFIIFHILYNLYSLHPRVFASWDMEPMSTNMNLCYIAYTDSLKSEDIEGLFILKVSGVH